MLQLSAISSFLCQEVRRSYDAERKEMFSKRGPEEDFTFNFVVCSIVRATPL